YRLGAAEAKADTHQLRLMLPPQGKLEIGAWNTQSNKFEAILTVDAATRNVTVAGDLIIEGALVKPAPPPAAGTQPDAAQQDTKEGPMQTVMDTVKGWLSTTMGSATRLGLLLALAFGLLNWDRAVTVLLPCSSATWIRGLFGLDPPACVGNVLFGSNC